MKIIFISTYYNEHLKEFCDELFKIHGHKFHFYETERDNKKYERGRVTHNKPSFVTFFTDSDIQDIMSADVVIAGASPYKCIKKRISNDKLTFLYQERSLKHGIELHKYLFRYIKWHHRYGHKHNCYILCASSFTSTDYLKFRLFNDKCFRFGYFPNRCKISEVPTTEERYYDSIFVARLIPLKQPEIFINLCKEEVERNNKNFKALIVGNGPLEQELKQMIKALKLENNVFMVGFKENKEVINLMKHSKSLVFCSNSQEGWGTVVNESMSCGCIPFVSNKIGSAKFLIKNYENGYVYKDINELSKLFLSFFNNPNMNRMSKLAKKTIDEEWNGIVAAHRFSNIINNMATPNIYEEGPMSLIH